MPGAESSEFLWGVATAGYQCEGGYNGPDQPQTNWAISETRKDVMPTGRGVEFWTRHAEDFRRCQKLGLNAFRLSFEWSRVQPTTLFIKSAPPPFDGDAIDHYARMIAECQRAGLDPVVTLFHFVHPAWLGTDAWLDDQTPHLFANFVREVVTRVNLALTTTHGTRPIGWYVTVNEPNMLVLNTYLGNQFPAEGSIGMTSMTRAYNNLMRAHVLAYNAINDVYEAHGWPKPAAALNNYCSDLYWGDKLLLDLLTSRERQIQPSDICEYIFDCGRRFDQQLRDSKIRLHRDLAYYVGSTMKRISNFIGYRRFDSGDFAPFLQTLAESPRPSVMDYIGIDYYDPFIAHAFRFPVFWDHEFRNKSFRSWVMNTIKSKWWDWRVLPRGLHFFCQCYAEEYKRGVLIAENGMALRRRPDNLNTPRRDGITRSQFLRLHVHEVVRIRKEGIPLLGYLHWSLFDNYEWGSYTPRFGLFAVDYATSTDRLIEDQYGDRPSETYRALIAEARQSLAAPEKSRETSAR